MTNGTSGRLRRGARRLTVVLAATVALLSAGAGMAAANTAQDKGDDVGVTSAYRCADAHGPGTWNKHCIEVEGVGLSVFTVEGHLTSTTAPYFPHQICGVTVYIWGVNLNGTAYQRSYRNNGCGLGSLGARFTVNNVFKNDSLLCARTVYDPARVPAPVCIRVSK